MSSNSSSSSTTQAAPHPTKRRLSDVSMDGDVKKKMSKKKRARRDSIDGTTGKRIRFEDEEGHGKKRKQEEEEEERVRLSAILSTFTKDQMERYESFRRSHFDRAKVKRVMRDVSGCKIPNKLAVAMGGIAKIFAGELIELARKDMGDFKGAIHPLHIRNAYRELRKAGKIPYLPTPSKGLLD